MNEQPPPFPAPPLIPDDAEMSAAFEEWLKACQKLIDDHYAKNLTNLQPSQLRFSVGPRFIAIRDHQQWNGQVSENGSAWAFIDRKGGMIGKVQHKRGDVLKPADWRAPAKHARGNLFDDHKGLKYMTNGGPAYLR